MIAQCLGDGVPSELSVTHFLGLECIGGFLVATVEPHIAIQVAQGRSADVETITHAWFVYNYIYLPNTA